MNKKGQMNNQIGMIITIFLVALLGAIFIQASAQNVGDVTNTVAVANTSLSTVVNGTAQYLTNYKSISSVVIYNATGNVIVGSGNYTITNNFVYNGAEVVKITPDATAIYKSAWKVSGTAQPQTYASESGTRAIAGLIIILFALAVAVLVLMPTGQFSKMFAK